MKEEKTVVRTLIWLPAAAIIALALYNAYEIRLYAVKDYGRVIHEFDPWFNFRATQYLADNGWSAFFTWFDHRSWYPLGRPVGTTIYPGMQIAAVGIWKVLNAVGIEISLNDVCVFVPAWFGVIATLLTGVLTYICTKSAMSAAIASLVMAILPAHLMRSVAGGFDNECVAVSCLLLTFTCWAKAISEAEASNKTKSLIWGALTGLSYICMVAAWGGFIFVLNLIASHCMFLCLPPLSRFNSSLHRAYTAFYVIGTLGAICVPVVGWGPLKSLEQLSGLAVFFGIQILQGVEIVRVKRKLSWAQVWQLRMQIFSIVMVVVAVIAGQLFKMGYFSPLTSRVRALFVAHTRTGNPLVDSVAEHQPASASSYNQYLSHTYGLARVGFGISAFYSFFYYTGYRKFFFGSKNDDANSENSWKISSASSFIAYYAVVGYFFCNKMSRLILLLGPVASVLTGVAVGFLIDFLITDSLPYLLGKQPTEEVDESPKVSPDTKSSNELKKKSKKGKSKQVKSSEPKDQSSLLSSFDRSGKTVHHMLYGSKMVVWFRFVVGILAVVYYFVPLYNDFEVYSNQLAIRMSHPSIMFKAQLKNGQKIIVDDYREAYWWLRDTTPDDARILSWWDYGYQISGIGNRTTLADGNTWNHEHIATIGRILTAPPNEAHKIARHLADYILVWTGGGGDDLAKSPHMARIGNSVYPGLCPDDPTCRHFGFYSINPMKPTKSMENSLLFKLCQSGITPGVDLDPKLFTPVFQSRFGKVRIYKIEKVSEKSKKWIADPANRLCESPGSWYCPGQYPPALKDFIASRIDFKQLEDFNKQQDETSKKYTEDYHRNMGNRGAAKSKKKKEQTEMKISLLGCYGAETEFPSERKYLGGTTGANAMEAVSYANENGFKYLAVAKVETDGHSFFFNEPPSGNALSLDKGCKRPCNDQANIFCGCADGGCGKLKKKSGSNDLRRWVVYEV